jgi:uncharacterized protein (TIGR03118 family)
MRTILLSTMTLALAGLGCGGTPEEKSDTTDKADPAEVAPEIAELKVGPSETIVEVVTQRDLVSDQAIPGAVLDPNLVNAWGLAFAPTGPAWVASNEKGLAEVYDSRGNLRLSVTIPVPKGAESPAAPTGQVFNPTTAFKGDRFILCTEGGTLVGWDGSNATLAALRADKSKREAIYKGLALLKSHGHWRLYVTDFHNNKIDVFDEHYRQLHLGGFDDPTLPPDYAPFNVVAQGNLLFVTYAKQDADKEDDVKGPGRGFVNVFDADGDQRVRLISRGALDAPWGMAFAPSPAHDLSVRLLVGNFGDGRINVYRLTFDDFRLHAELEGALGDAPNHALAIDGLWALAFGPGANGFGANELFFTAGPVDESHGLFGKLQFSDVK